MLIKSVLGLTAVLAVSQMSAQTQESSEQAETAEAQPSSFTFTNDISTSYSGDTDMKDVGKGLGGISSYDLADSFGYTIRSVPDMDIDVGAAYRGSFFDIEHETASPMVKRLQSISTGASTKWMINEEWIIVGGAGIGWHNSGTAFNSHGIGVSGIAGAIRNFGPDLSLMLGVGYNSLAKEGHKLLPGFGVRYVYSPEWTFSLGFPETAITWTANERLRLSFVAEGNYETYYVRSKDLTTESVSRRVGDSCMEYSDFRAGIRADYDISKNFSVSATAGYLFSRKFDFYESDYKLESDGGAPYGSIHFTAKF